MVKNITTLIKAAEYLDHRDRGKLNCLLCRAALDVMPRNVALFYCLAQIVVAVDLYK